MPDERVVNVRYKISVDEASSKAAADHLKNFQRSFDDGVKRAEKAQRAYNELGRSLPGPAGDIFRTVGDIKDIPGALKSLSASGTIVGGLKAAALAAGPLALGLGALALSTKLLEESAANARKPVEAFLSSLAKVDVGQINAYQTAATATNKSLSDSRNQQELYRQQLEQNRKQLQAFLDKAAQESTGVRAYDEAFVHAQQSVREQLAQTNKQLETTRGNFEALNSSLVLNAAAAREYVAALQQRVKSSVETDRLVKSGTPDQAQSMIAGLQAEQGAAAQAFTDLAKRTVDSIVRSATSQGVTLEGVGDLRDKLGYRGKVGAGFQSGLADLSSLSSKLNLTPEQMELIKGLQDLGQVYADDTEKARKLRYEVLPLIELRQREAEAVKKVTEWQQQNAKALQNYFDALASTQTQIKDTQSQRKKELARRAEQDAIDAERSEVEKGFARKIEIAQKEDEIDSVRADAQKADLDAQGKLTDDKQKINDDWMAGELKALTTFRKQEEQDTAQYTKQRRRTIEDAQDDLLALSGSRDITAFVLRQRSFEKDLKRQAEDQDDATKERLAAYLDQRKEAQQQHSLQLKDLQSNFDKEHDVRQRDANERIRDLEANGRDGNSRASALEQELNDIREGWRRDDLKRQRDLEAADFAERLALLQAQSAQLQAAYSETYQKGLQMLNYTPTVFNAPQDFQTDKQKTRALGQKLGVPSFREGIDYVPYDMVANIHRGERIVTASQNQGGGITVQVSVVNPIGADNIVKSATEGALRGVLQAKRLARAQLGGGAN